VRPCDNIGSSVWIRPRQAASKSQSSSSHPPRFGPFLADDAQQVLELARRAAQTLRHDYLGSEHLLLGLRRAVPGQAAALLENFAVEPRIIEIELEKIVSPAKQVPSDPPFTPLVRKIMERAALQAARLGHPLPRSIDLLSELVKETESVAVQMLITLGVNLELLQKEIMLTACAPKAAEHVRDQMRQS
jgi:ATP-dependent Clp protease ATP-binding subunit ClpC